MNVSQLQIPPSVHLNRTAKEGAEKEAKFLAFKQLNKRARVRLSQTPLLTRFQAKAHLFAVANSGGWFTAVTPHSDSESTLIFSPLSDLRAAFSSTDKSELFIPQRVLVVQQTPVIVKFASNDTRMVLGLASGLIQLYDTSVLFTPGSTHVQPIHSWPSVPNSLRHILPNPGEMPDQVAILREANAPIAVEIFDVQKLESIGGWSGSNVPESTPTSLAWSPRGKQLAIGLQSGSILTFIPTATSAPKQHIPAPPFPTPHSLLSITWLSTPTFHAIYASPSTPDPTHVVVTFDSKARTAEDVKLASPNFLPAGSTPNTFSLAMRNWNQAKAILVVGDGASPDIGVIANLDDEWCNLSLEETSTPQMPLDEDGNETVLMGLELDLTNDQPLHVSIDGVDVQIPPPPIIYVYASDGTVQGWYVVNSGGEQYPGLVTSAIGGRISTSASPQVAGTTPFGQFASSTITPPASVFGQPGVGLGGSAFGQQTSSSVFGQPSFGQPSFSAQPTAFGGTTSSSGGVGFSAFASPTPAKFGQGDKTPSPVEAMSTDTSPLSLGGLSFGGPSDSKSNTTTSVFGKSAFGAPFGTSTIEKAPASNSATGVFGPFTTKQTTDIDGGSDVLPASRSEDNSRRNTTHSSPDSSPPKNTAPLPTQGFSQLQSSNSALLRPAAGFGAFGSDAKPTSSPFFNTKPQLSVSESASAFKPLVATSAFGAPSQIGKGGSVFGAPSLLGSVQSAFGGTTSSPLVQNQSKLSSSGGFGAYSGTSSGFGAFAGPQKAFGELLKEGDPPASSSPKPVAGDPTITDKGSEKEIGKAASSLGFGAFAGTSGGFGAFASLQKTFGVLLKEGDPPASSSPKPVAGEPTMTDKGSEKEMGKAASSLGFGAFAGTSGGLGAFASLPKTFGDLLKKSDTLPAQPSSDSPSLPKSSGTDVVSNFRGLPQSAQSVFITPATKQDPASGVPRDRDSAVEDIPTKPSSQEDNVAPSESTLTKEEVSAEASDEDELPSGNDSSSESVGSLDLSEHGDDETGGGHSSSLSAEQTPKAPSPILRSISRSPSTTPKPHHAMQLPTSSERSPLLKPTPLRPRTPPLLDNFLKPSVASKSPLSSAYPPVSKSPSLDVAPSAPQNFLNASPRGSPRLSQLTHKSGNDVLASLPPVSSLFGAKESGSAPSLPKPQLNTSGGSSQFSSIASPRNKSDEKLPPSFPSLVPSPGSAASKDPQQGMQAECIYLFSTLAKELECLKALAQETRKRRAEISSSAGGPRRTADLDHHAKWSLIDVTQFGLVMKQLQTDIEQLQNRREEQSRSVHELQGQMLKAETRKEEIERFRSAKTDAEFTKMLKMRTLGAEHLETQNQLRRDVGAIRDRIQKLQDHLQISKKKLRQMKTAQPSLKAPSLDTINRTYRNVDIAIDQQARDVARLTSRLAKLNVGSAVKASATRDKRLPDRRSPFTMTPHVATSTAASLNAERSALKLKRALIVRKEPLLNTSALAFNAVRQETAPTWSMPQPELVESPSPPTSLPTRRTGGSGTKHHSKPISFKRNIQAGQPSQAPSFDWGPLPSIMPMTTISVDLRKKDGESPDG